jgi:hypothetical protein
MTVPQQSSATENLSASDRPFEQGVWTGMQIGIGLIVLPIVVEIVWAMTPLQAPPSLQWAIRAGLLVMLAGLLSFTAVPEPGRVRTVQVAIVGYPQQCSWPP